MRTIKTLAAFVCAAFMMSFTHASVPQSAQHFSQKTPPVKWKTTTIELGEIPVGKPVTLEFEFTNTGKEDVIIMDAKPTCGCTIASFPKEPVQPGKTAKIVAVFNAAAKGVFDKHITVTLQNEEPISLGFKGTVI